MPCECLSHDGSLSDTCLGFCRSARMINPDKQIRVQEDSFTPNQLQQLKNIIREALSVSPMLDQVWQDAFIRGYKHGYQDGQE